MCSKHEKLNDFSDMMVVQIDDEQLILMLI